ncbi:MAG: TolC family protein [Polyangia bacterium]
MRCTAISRGNENRPGGLLAVAVLALALVSGAAAAQQKRADDEQKGAEPGRAEPESTSAAEVVDEARESGASAPDEPAAEAEVGSPPVELDLPESTPGEPITLAEALRAADTRNVKLAAARLEVDKAEARLKQAWGLVLPGAQASMQLMHRDHADTVNFADSMPSSMSGMVDMGETVVMPQDDLKGSIGVGMSLVNAESWWTIGVADKGVEVAELSIDDVRQQLLLGVAKAYYFALMADSLIEMNEEAVGSAAHHLEVARARHDAGTGLRIDVIRAETDLEEARQQLLSSHLSLDNARDALGVLTGIGGLPMPVREPDVRPPEGEEHELVERARSERSDLASKRETVELMDLQLEKAWMQFLPTLDASWGLDYQFTEPGDLGSQDRSRWALIFNLSVPIYNHFRYGDLDEKRASLRQAMLQFEDVERDVDLEVRQKRRDYLTALSTIEIAENQSRLADEALELVEASYRAGTGTSLDVTDARRTKSATDVNLAAKRLEAQIALLELLRSVGEDMTELPR